MAYELYIFPLEGGSGVPTKMILDAFNELGIPCSEQADDSGHWLVLEGFESALDLTKEDSVAMGANFRFSVDDDPVIVEKVAEAFKSIGWQVADEEGFL